MADNRVVIYVQQGNLVKITSSRHPPNRLKIIEEETGQPATLLGIQAGGVHQCLTVCDLFRHLHVEEDWYRAAAELVEYIEQNATIDRSKPLSWDEIKEKYGCYDQTTEQGKECRKLLNQSVDLPSDEDGEKLILIDQAASMLGISQQTLRNWEEKGKIVPQRTEKGHRRYTKAQIMEVRRQQMKDQEFLLPNVTPNDVLDMVHKLLTPFDPLEKVNVTIKQDSLLGKVTLTIDTLDGLNSVVKSFSIKE